MYLDEINYVSVFKTEFYILINIEFMLWACASTYIRWNNIARDQPKEYHLEPTNHWLELDIPGLEIQTARYLIQLSTERQQDNADMHCLLSSVTRLSSLLLKTKI